MRDNAAMDTTENANVARVREYLQALEAGATGEALRRYFAADAVQIELPNRLNPKGGRSDLATLLRRSEEGKAVLQRQTYEVGMAVAQGDRVAMEARWTGVLAIPLATLKAGDAMVAHFGMFFELEGGRIKLQRNYDCFEAF